MSEGKAILAREKEATQRKRAAANFSQAKRAVDELTRVARKRLLNQPGSEALRYYLFDKAVRFYEEFAQRSEQDPSLGLQTAEAYRQLGDNQELVNKPADAAGSYRKAATLFQAQLGSAAVDGDNAVVWRELAAARMRLWTVLENDATAQTEAEDRPSPSADHL